MGGARASLIVAGAGAMLALTCGCPSASFEEHGATSLAGAPGPTADPAALTRAQPVPLLYVSPTDALSATTTRFEVYTREKRGATTLVSLLPILPDGEPTADLRKLVELAYRFGAGVDLPLDAGQRVQLSLSTDGGGKGLIVAREDADGSATTTAIVSVDGGFAKGALEDLTVTPDRGDTIVYSEVRTEASGCAIALDHFELVVKTPKATVSVPPGAIRDVEHDGAMWSFVALDASRPSDQFGDEGAGAMQRCPSGAHVSWLMLARSGPGRVAPPAP